jgi:hypothetical protein
MSQPEDTFERRITGHLDRGADRIDAATRERLIAARERALLTYRATVPVPGLAWAGRAMPPMTGHRFHSLRNAVALAAVLLALTGLAIWISVGPTNEIAEIDAGLLTDDLPINAYLDKGFDSWLKRGSR